ncbi:MAG: hypothetical protein DI535_23085 [Citrobacter freundii]|nr:MAG: hypothetical protein DI535_23085 [Citrobacter freundii]
MERFQGFQVFKRFERFERFERLETFREVEAIQNSWLFLPSYRLTGLIFTGKAARAVRMSG